MPFGDIFGLVSGVVTAKPPFCAICRKTGGVSWPSTSCVVYWEGWSVKVGSPGRLELQGIGAGVRRGLGRVTSFTAITIVSQLLSGLRSIRWFVYSVASGPRTWIPNSLLEILDVEEGIEGIPREVSKICGSSSFPRLRDAMFLT